ncbi:NAD(P)-dependent oxidoreductase [Virgisporangium aliadipatigenens]|uniref:dTDP-4-dehydrorhamnose reductase n=1 Tax=Virgisporangium aliadipatigenens TaxID=741659 RepID=A0A8J4DRW0_9ACTN|nr:dTDP-4-dehydrorhamnose reductase [Virgisporangium aliadipatigenens]GIJ46692.1 NAD(P)-dependent oxidoreductase [Virgisporangium aliadipatigenens]
MSWLVTGAGGQLGTDMCAVLDDAGVKYTALRRADLDITDPEAVRNAVAGHEIVLNAAAWTDVDGAEADEAAATAVNGDGVRHLAAACAAADARLLHISTDYVFPGDATAPYTEDAPTGPINAYGRSKLAGERAVLELHPREGFVIRTAWLYGAHGPNFVRTMLRLAAEREFVDVVDDQRGQPTWSYMLATWLYHLGTSGDAGPGVYHGTCTGETTWYGLARAVFAGAGLDPERVRPTTSAAYVRPAPRPSYSVLRDTRYRGAGIAPMPPWDVALEKALPALLAAR